MEKRGLLVPSVFLNANRWLKVQCNYNAVTRDVHYLCENTSDCKEAMEKLFFVVVYSPLIVHSYLDLVEINIINAL